ncbi:MAG: helix-turn-helix domain-containing protein [Mediterranea sp.]|nr:helix-turn-helix domain-containing protein [Mediterranea sp.]
MDSILRQAREAERKQSINEAMRLWFDAFNEYQLRLHDYHEAFACANQIERLAGHVPLEKCPEILLYYTVIADLYYEFEDYENSLDLLDYVVSHPRMAERVGTLARAYYTLGLTYLMLKEYERAEGAFKLTVHRQHVVMKDSIDKDTWDEKGRAGLGYLYLVNEEFQRSITPLRNVVAALNHTGEYKEAGEYAALLAYSYTKLNKLDSACYYIGQADDLFSMAKPVRIRWGLLHWVAAEYELAMGRLSDSHEAFLLSYREVQARKEELNSIKLFNVRRVPRRNWDDDPQKESEKSYSLFDRIITDTAIGLLILIPLLIFLMRKRMPAQPVEKEKTETDSQKDEALYAQITSYMEESKPYLSPTFDIDDLCEALRVGTKSVSGAINRIGQRNFRSFVNHYRVNTAIDLMSSAHGSRMSVDALALEAGFSDRSSFWRAFKKEKGLSPTEYSKNIEVPDETLP